MELLLQVLVHLLQEQLLLVLVRNLLVHYGLLQHWLTTLNLVVSIVRLICFVVHFPVLLLLFFSLLLDAQEESDKVISANWHYLYLFGTKMRERMKHILILIY